MKRSSLDHQSTDSGDDEFNQAFSSKMVRRSPPRFKYNSQEKIDQRRQEIPMDQGVVRQDLL